MLDVMLTHDVSLENAGNPATIVALRAKYVAGVTTVSAKADEQASQGESLLKQVTALATTEDNITKVAELRKQIRALVWTAVEDTPAITCLLGDVLGELKTDVLGERDYLLGKVRAELRPSATIPTDELQDRKDELEDLAKLIRWLWDLVKNADWSDEDKKAFPVKAKQEGGKPVKGVFLPDLPKLPRTPSDNAAPVGRAAVIGRMQFRWNGEDIPKGEFVTDIAHDRVSDPKSGFVVDLRGIQEALKAVGKDFYSQESWSIEFPTGTLERAELPPKK